MFVINGLGFCPKYSRYITKRKEPFILTYYDIREDIRQQLPEGKIIVDFYINERGEVEDPVIKDTFNIDLNEVVLDKLKEVSYYPATQNGEPIKIKYTLPIVFK